MLKFIIGFILGGAFGATTMILAQAAKQADKDMPKPPESEITIE